LQEELKEMLMENEQHGFTLSAPLTGQQNPVKDIATAKLGKSSPDQGSKVSDEEFKESPAPPGEHYDIM
jgi:hypothetical protein